MNGLPLLVDLAAAPVLVVGGGEVAERRIAELLTAGAYVTVIAPQLTTQIDAWADQRQCRHFPTRFRDDHLDERWALVIAATADRTVNAAVAEGARARRLLVNVVSDACLGNVAVPARVVRGPLQLAFSTGGVAPVLARKLRTLVEALLPESLAEFIAVAERERPRLKTQGEVQQRRRVWERFFDAAWAGQTNAEQALKQALTVEDHPVLWLLTPPTTVDALTLRQLRQMQQAERVWIQGEVAPQLLTLCRRDAHIAQLPTSQGQTSEQGQPSEYLLASKGQPSEQLLSPLLPSPRGAETALLLVSGADLERYRAAAIVSGWQPRICGQ